MDSELRAELTQLQGEWLAHLRAWERSGLSLKAYAVGEGLDHRRLYRFKRLLTDKGVYQAGEATSVRFARAQFSVESEPAAMCRVRFPNGCVVEIGVELNGAGLRELLHSVSVLR